MRGCELAFWRTAMLVSGVAAHSAGARAAQFDIHGPSGSIAFGTSVKVLSNGNIVVVDPSGPVSNIGAVYLYSPAGALIAALTGASASDQVGSGGIVLLGNGNFVVLSPQWSNNGAAAAAGAATWVNGTTGLSGVVAAANSLVGASAGDLVGSFAMVLANGNYVVGSPSWNGTIGAATWGSGTSGTSGAVSGSNSLIGTAAGDKIGARVSALTNGNYVVSSATWNGGRGAATWANGATGASGVVSSINSLIGSSTSDAVGGLSSVVPLSNGNYVVATPLWNAGTGAVTWGDGAAGITGEISSANSLVGSTPGDQVGFRVTRLASGGYVVYSGSWNGNRGAATFGSASGGVSGPITASNSLIGSAPNDYVGYMVTALSNGNYVVRSPYWNGQVGAASWGDGSTGITGQITASNSLIGSTANDRVGLQNVVELTNGNYVICSPNWNGNAGAATWGPAAGGVKGILSSFNSLVGSTPGDQVGLLVWALTNGNYVVASPHWSGDIGAVTWGDGSTGSTDAVSADISLTGSVAGDGVGNVTGLTNGDYVVASPGWNGGVGAVTRLGGTAATKAVVSSSNSLVGSSPGDDVGAVVALANGNYVVRSGSWNGNAGAVTWVRGSKGLTGPVLVANSLIGSVPGEQVGGGIGAGAVELGNGAYLITSPAWDGVGAFTLASVAFALVGTVQPWNSVTGTTPGAGASMVYAYDASRQRLAVGRPADNIVSLFTMEQLFAANFDRD